MTGRHAEFVAEAEELLDEASTCLIEIQDALPDPDPDLVNSVFRVMHTLKGMSGLFGFQDFSGISHHLENLLDMIRLGKATLDMETTVFLFGQLDTLKGMLQAIRSKKNIDEAITESSLREIEKFMGGLSGKVSIEGSIPFPGKYRNLLKILSEYEEHRLRANIKEGKTLYLLTTTYPLEEFDVLLKALVGRIKAVGEVISTMPVSNGVPSGQIGFHVMVASMAGQAKLEETADGPVIVLVGKGGAFDHDGGGDTEGAAPDASLKSLSASVRVDITKVDSILDTISDLALRTHELNSLWKGLGRENVSMPIAIGLYSIAQSMQRKLSLLQSQVLDIRMVPVRQIFSRLSRIVKRHSAEAGRKIALTMYGEDTELDKYVAEEVVDPLMHLVRNAIDHGIEGREEREAAGKSEAGNLELRAFQKGKNVIISVTDDGRGIDPDKVREKALEKGLVSDSDTLDRGDILDLIFQPGFSTAREVSETSGRGVGLDVVKDRISFLGGSVAVSGESGEGATFSLTLPITLSLIRALLVRVQDEIFAVPLSSMSETFVAEKEDLQELEGGLACNFRGDLLPLFTIGSLLELAPQARDRYFAVIAGQGDRRVGLLVDEFLGQQEIIIKPLGGYFDGLKGYAGAAEIGKHRIILVLDTETLINNALSKKRKVAGLN